MLSVCSLSTMLAVTSGSDGPGAPAHEPQMAANGSMVAMTFGAGNAIYFSASHDAGKTFSTPVQSGGGGSRAAHAAIAVRASRSPATRS